MDVEKTIEFLLAQQAGHAAWQSQFENDLSELRSVVLRIVGSQERTNAILETLAERHVELTERHADLTADLAKSHADLAADLAKGHADLAADLAKSHAELAKRHAEWAERQGRVGRAAQGNRTGTTSGDFHRRRPYIRS